MKKLCTVLTAMLLSSWAWSQSIPDVVLQPVASGFTEPIGLANAGDERIFVVEKAGIIIAWNPTSGTKDTFLNITDNVLSAGGEQGLLDIAFHPDYATNGYFYVTYTAPDSDNTGVWVLARYSVTADSNDADESSEQILFTQDKPFANHNGGWVEFGPDGYLYASIGDGGSGGDPFGNGQNLNTKLGKILRVDVSDSTLYSIPSTNPFANDTTADPTIWAYGLRNPWRNSFDRLTGDLWIADVGQDVMEEVNVQAATSGGGQNYGWRCYEGTLPFNTTGCADPATMVFPIFAYNHSSDPCSGTVVGGRVYRGGHAASLYGRYIFADYCNGLFRALTADGNGGYTMDTLLQGAPFEYTSFGEDIYGEVYVTEIGSGVVAKIVDTSCVPTAIILGDDSINSCGDVTLQAVDGAGLTYQWYADEVAVADANASSYVSTNAGSYYVEVTDTTCGGISLSNIVTISSLNIDLDVVVTNNNCTDSLGGSISITPLNGTPPFTYLWSNGSTDASIVDVPNGVYGFTVTAANGCTGGGEANVFGTLGLVVDAIVTDAGCTDSTGSIILNVTGGALPYTFEWENGATDDTLLNLAAGIYKVTVMGDNGCTGAGTFVVMATNAPFVEILVDSVDCDLTNVVLTANVIGSAPPFTYLWDNGSTDATTTVSGGGSFSVTVTDDGGCSAVDSAFVLPTPPLLVMILGDTTVCPGDLTTLMTDADNMTYLWSTGDTTASISVGEGTYSVTVYNSNGCVAGTAEETVTTNSLPILSFTTTNATAGQSDGSADLTVTGDDAPFTYAWSNGGTDEDLTNVAAGVYNVTVTSAEGCIVTDSVTIGEDVVTECAAPTNLSIDNITATSVDISWDAVSGATQYIVQYRPVGDTAWLSVGVDTNALFLFTLESNTLYEVQVQTVCGDSTSGNMAMTTFTTLNTGGCTLTVNIGHTNATCFGLKTGSATAVAVGGTGPYTYLWSNGRTQSSLPKLAAGTYSVTVTDANGCTAVGTVSISQPAPILAYQLSTQTCPGQCTGTAEVFWVSGGIAPLSYMWSNGETTTSITNLCAGIYWVTITDASGCKKIVGSAVSANPSVCGSGGPGPQRVGGNAVTAFNVYPNPADATINVTLPAYEGAAHIEIYNAMGQLVITTTVESRSYTSLDVSQFASGVYHVQFVNNGLVESTKFIKQ